MDTSEWIATGASAVALTSALISGFFASQSNKAARRANEISVSHNLRPNRLQMYNELRSFAKYCEQYYTRYCMADVEGTKDLVNKICELEAAVNALGPLNMPNVQVVLKQLLNRAWGLQRDLDRFIPMKNEPAGEEKNAAEDSVQSHAAWFHERQQELQVIAEPYLLPPESAAK